VTYPFISFPNNKEQHFINPRKTVRITHMEKRC
jgi:hypothetical protein